MQKYFLSFLEKEKTNENSNKNIFFLLLKFPKFKSKANEFF